MNDTDIKIMLSNISVTWILNSFWGHTIVAAHLRQGEQGWNGCMVYSQGLIRIFIFIWLFIRELGRNCPKSL